MQLKCSQAQKRSKDIVKIVTIVTSVVQPYFMNIRNLLDFIKNILICVLKINYTFKKSWCCFRYIAILVWRKWLERTWCHNYDFPTRKYELPRTTWTQCQTQITLIFLRMHSIREPMCSTHELSKVSSFSRVCGISLWKLWAIKLSLN